MLLGFEAVDVPALQQQIAETADPACVLGYLECLGVLTHPRPPWPRG